MTTGMWSVVGVAMQRCQQPEAVEAGHHHVGEHEIRRIGPGELKRGLAVGGRLHVVLGAEQRGDVVAHVRVVVGHQNARAIGARRASERCAA